MISFGINKFKIYIGKKTLELQNAFSLTESMPGCRFVSKQ